MQWGFFFFRNKDMSLQKVKFLLQTKLWSTFFSSYIMYWVENDIEFQYFSWYRIEVLVSWQH